MLLNGGYKTKDHHHNCSPALSQVPVAHRWNPRGNMGSNCNSFIRPFVYLRVKYHSSDAAWAPVRYSQLWSNRLRKLQWILMHLPSSHPHVTICETHATRKVTLFSIHGVAVLEMSIGCEQVPFRLKSLESTVLQKSHSKAFLLK